MNISEMYIKLQEKVLYTAKIEFEKICSFPNDINGMPYNNSNTGKSYFSSFPSKYDTTCECYTAQHFVARKNTNPNNVRFFIKYDSENNSIATDRMIENFAEVVRPDHARMVRHGQVHGRFSSPLPSENEIDHVTMLILDTYIHEGEISLSSSIRTHVHGQHGHVNIWSIIALKSDHEGDHDLTMPDHVFPKFVEVNQNVAL